MAGKSILVVDDDRAIAQLIADTLEARGYRVHQSRDGAEAAEAFGAGAYDLLITDVQMPRMNGIELVRTLRERGSRVPVLMMSSMATGLTRDRAVRLGSLVFLDKPFDPQRLPDLAADLIRKGGAPPVGRPRILLADDHAPTLTFLTSVLSAAGYEVMGATDGEEAVARLKDTRPSFDLAMIDVSMPKKSGPEVIQEMARIAPETLPIMMTGEATQEEVRKGYERGGYTLIRKPFEIDSLLRFLAQTEEEGESRRLECAVRDYGASRPLPIRAVRAIRDVLRAPSSSPLGRRLQTFWMVIACVVIAMLVLWVAGRIETYMTGSQGSIERFMNRIEGYLERDEQRELKGTQGH